MRDPLLGTLLGQFVLVVLVEHATNELAILHGLGSLVLVAIRGGETVHLGSGIHKEIVELSSGVTIVVTVGLLVANSKNSNLLALYV